MRFFAKKNHKTAEAVDKPKKDAARRKGWRHVVTGGTAFFALGSGATLLLQGDHHANPPAKPAAPAVSTAPLPYQSSEAMAFYRNSGDLTCAMTGTADFAQRVPRIQAVFTKLAQQPISGQQMVMTVTDPRNQIEACLVRDLSSGAGSDRSVLGLYTSNNHRLSVLAGNPAPAVIAHESFHAYQQFSGGFSAMTNTGALYARDRATGLLLMEATAAAYEQVVMKEISFTDAKYPRSFRRDNDFHTNRTFDRAYDDSYAANATLPEAARRRVALQAGGQAVVRFLMAGHDAGWRTGYRDNALPYARLTSAHAQDPQAYAQKRAGFYRALGNVAPGLQLVPDEFLDARADASIAQVLKTFRIDAPAAPAYAASPRAATPPRPPAA